MYGMVTKAVKELIDREFGEQSWSKIKAQAGLESLPDVFISNQPYPDEITYKLLGAAAEVLEVPIEQILEAFGRHWILHTAQEGYAELLQSTGKTLPEFLENLPNFHTRIGMIFPDLDPPEFQVTEFRDDSLHLHYRSHRQGLTHFVFGLLEGLATLYDTRISTRLIESKTAGADHDVFLVEWDILRPL